MPGIERTPAGERPDHEIQREVLDELEWEPRVEANEIGVIVKDRIVTLAGGVSSLMMRWAAEEAAHRVRGVRAVANELEVQLPGPSERTDAGIASSAALALESNASLQPDDIEVTVSNGWITLGGTVQWSFQKEEAERLMRSLWGVKGISNLLTARAR